MSLDGIPLTGGVSSDIRLVQTPDGPIVVKQALDRLKVEAEWHSDPARASVEVRALKVAADLVGPDHVPKVLWEEPDRHTFAMTLADPVLRNWKQDLLADRVDLATAQAAGLVLGRFHGGSAASPGLAEAFEDLHYFKELRVEPFFERVAQLRPEVAGEILAVAADMEQRRLSLVHGDYSPKNMLADGGRLVILDFEVTHWGDPAFDVAFCLSHLLLKSRRSASSAGQDLLDAGRAFLEAYWTGGGVAPDDQHLARLTACLVLARIDGPSPVDYDHQLDRGAVRSFAIHALLSPPHSVRQLLKNKG